MSQGRGIREGAIEESRTEDLPRYPAAETEDEVHGRAPDRGSSTDPARGVTVVVVVVVILVVVGFVILHLAGGGLSHGGR